MASKTKPAPEPVSASASGRPATDKLAALRAARLANGGLVVLPPQPLAVLNNAKFSPPSNINNGHPVRSASLDLVERWFRAIVAAGGSKGDLMLAFHQWRPGDTSGAKRALQPLHDALMIEAEIRYGELLAAAAREAWPERQAAQREAALKAARAEVEKAQKVAGEKRARLQQIEGTAA